MYELRDEILRHAYAYYINNAPLISDAEYDKLFFSLKKLEECENYPEDKKITNKVACGVIANSLTDIKHSVPMLSLDNIFSMQEYYDWVNSIKLNNDEDLVASPKLDGASLSLYYSNRVLVYALRRGDGITGQDITANALKIKGIITVLPESFPKTEIIIRGEVVCPVFKEKYSADYKTHRNFVSGSMNLKNPKEIATRGLKFIAYRIIGANIPTYWESMTALSEAGFPVVTDIYAALTSAGDFDILNIATQIQELDDSIPFDGLVLMINNLNLFESLKSTSHHPRGAIAFKTATDEKETQITAVTWQVGKTGIITPVAHLTPIELNDTTVQRCTLHNIDEVKKLNVAVNDTVLVTKAAFIIPKILRVTQRPHNRIPIMIYNCPSCDEPVKQEGAYIKCNNKSCGEQAAQRVIRFVKNARFIGFGEATIRKLIQLGMPDKISSLFKVSRKMLYDATGGSEKLTEKLAEKLITRPAEMSFTEALSSINIPFVNMATAQKFIDAGITSVLELRDYDKLVAIHSIGHKKAVAINNYISDNFSEIQELMKFLPLALTVRDKVTSKELIPIVLSGTLKNSSRDKAKAILEQHGYKLLDNVSSKTAFLLLANNPGQSKIKKAQQYNIPIIEYENSEFKNII